MKIVFRLFAFLVSLLLAAVLLSALLGWIASNTLLEEQADVDRFESTSIEDLRRIKQMVVEFSRQDPRNEVKQVALSERDINLAIGHFVPRQTKLPADTFFAVTLDAADRATINASAPAHPLATMLRAEYRDQLHPLAQPLLDWLVDASSERWLNVTLELRVDTDAGRGDWLATERISVGSLPLSESLSRSIAARVLDLMAQRRDLELARQSWQNLRSLRVDDDARLHLGFILPKQAIAGLGSVEALVLQPGEQELVELYTRQLNSLPRSGALVKIIAPMFEMAARRSAQSGDAIAENRALLLSLARRYGGEQLLTMLEAGQRRMPGGIPRPYTIYGRQDLAQHMVLSAGLSLIASQEIAELFGIEKELADLVGGRSISAWDLLADKAGVRLAENATASPRSASEIQKWFSRARRDRDLLPDLGAEFAYSEDSFGPEEFDQLELMIELYLEQHPALRKRS